MNDDFIFFLCSEYLSVRVLLSWNCSALSSGHQSTKMNLKHMKNSLSIISVHCLAFNSAIKKDKLSKKKYRTIRET